MRFIVHYLKFNVFIGFAEVKQKKIDSAWKRGDRFVIAAYAVQIDIAFENELATVRARYEHSLCQIHV